MTLVSNKDNPLVSCAVISYNSATTILETLESIKGQSYHCIELIISDDGSKDNTVELCNDWIKHNKDNFTNTVIITTEKNTGVAENCNRVLSACKGEWLKIIAADDILLPNCVCDFMKYISDHPGVLWISSLIRKYKESFEESNCVGRNVVVDIPFFNMTAKQQLLVLARRNTIYAPSLFYNITFAREIGFDPKYIHEDLPFYVNALEKGQKCYFMNKETVCYRVHQSISQSNAKLFNYDILLGFRQFQRERLLKYLKKQQYWGEILIWRVQDCFEFLGLNKRKKINNYLYNKTCNIITKLFGIS